MQQTSPEAGLGRHQAEGAGDDDNEVLRDEPLD